VEQSLLLGHNGRGSLGKGPSKASHGGMWESLVRLLWLPPSRALSEVDTSVLAPPAMSTPFISTTSTPVLEILAGWSGNDFWRHGPYPRSKLSFPGCIQT